MLRRVSQLFLLAALAGLPVNASVLDHAQAENRVRGQTELGHVGVGAQRDASAELHWGNRDASTTIASGCLLGPRLTPAMTRQLGNATQAFRSGPLTNVGRALTKHPNIVGESGNVLQRLGGAANVNTAGARALENIMRTGTMTTKSTKSFGNIIQYTLESGLGARFSATTGEFIGFIGRGL